MRAPGRTDPAAALRAAHHLTLGHGLAVGVLRDTLPERSAVSLTFNLAAVRGRSQSAADRDAVRRIDALAHRIFLDPVFHGHYPQDLRDDTAALTDWSFVRDGDLAETSRPLDVLGLNHHTPTVVAAADPVYHPASVVNSPWPGAEQALRLLPAAGPCSATGRPADADGLTELLGRLHRELPRTPLLITGNGAAYDDCADPAGDVHDPDRIAHLDAHLTAVHGAIGEGVNIRGYFIRSLLDDFEWPHGYGRRFGIVHVDFASRRRTLKDSARWYAALIAANSRTGKGESGGRPARRRRGQQFR